MGHRRDGHGRRDPPAVRLAGVHLGRRGRRRCWSPSSLLPAADALAGVPKGTDVYLFLIGMMLLAELAREEGLFDWLAAGAARLARGSATRLFTWSSGSARS